MSEQPAADFEDLLRANAEFAQDFSLAGLPGAAGAGVAIVTCMDSRIDPLRILGLQPGDAKVFRNPGGRVTEAALEAVVLATNLLGARRVLVIPHTRCAMASSTEAQIRERIGTATGIDPTWQRFSVVEDQQRALADDVAKVRSHPLIASDVLVGGFVYDVDTGRLSQQV